MATEQIRDGQFSFLGGQDASKNPDEIAENAYASGVNVTAANGDLGPRWGFRKLDLNIESGFVLQENLYERDYERIFNTGKFQLADAYIIGGVKYGLIVISGIIYIINPDTYETQVLEIEGGEKLNEFAPRLNGTPAGSYYVIFDYPAAPIIIEGFSARRADLSAGEVPVSVLGTYNQNRLFIANAGQEYTAGDPSGSLATPDAPITFLEIQTQGSGYFGQVFKLPTAYDNAPITAMTFLQVSDTSTGIGPLLISTADQIVAAQAQLPRDDWLNSTFATLFVQNNGIAGPRAHTPVGSDVFFLGGDGQVRTVSSSREEQGRWARVPLSREVKNWLNVTDQSMLKYGVLAYFQNKILISARPVHTKATSIDGQSIPEVCHGGMVVFALDNLTNLGQANTPAWEGLWTGVRPLGFIQLDNKLLVVSKDNFRANVVYEIDPNLTYDVVDNGRVRPIRSILYSREYTFQSPLQNKEIRTFDMNLEDVKGDFKLNLKYRPGSTENFLQWADFCHNAPWRFCAAPGKFNSAPLVGHDFREVNLGSPEQDNAFNPITEDNFSTFRRLQLRLEISGVNWRLHGFRISATIAPENETQSVRSSQSPGECPYETTEVYGECSSDWTIEGEDLCQAQQT